MRYVQSLVRETGETGTDRGREDGDCEDVEEEEKERLMMYALGRVAGGMRQLGIES